MANRSNDDPEVGRDAPALWFIRLEDAIRAGDRRKEQVARRELERLGVRVEVAPDAFRSPADSVDGGGDASADGGCKP